MDALRDECQRSLDPKGSKAFQLMTLKQSYLGTLARTVFDLGPTDTIRLALWKLRGRATRDWDRILGFRRMLTKGEDWEKAWLDEWGPLGVHEWCSRNGSGSLWLSVDEADAWCRATCSKEDLEWARASHRGVFDLIGSGPITLGTPPQWRRDLYSGNLWPLTESATLPMIRGDGSDIRTVWELSRGYHIISLARAYWATGQEEFVQTFVSHVESWIEQNPLGYGPHWQSPMDAAIRASNWALALVLFAKAEQIESTFWGRLLTHLRVTATFVERYREWHPRYRGNHYIANMVGLVYVGALFYDDPVGRRWFHRGASSLQREIVTQVHPDGVSFEGSIGYHRLVTEFFAFAGEVIRRTDSSLLCEPYDDRLRRMYGFIATYLSPAGDAPLIGDNDDGRLHATSAEGFQNPRRHALGLPQRWWPQEPPTSRTFPEGGFHILRVGKDHCVVRCGPLGLNGAGSHDHNDQLSFELWVDGCPVVRDAGTYCYTRDLSLRYRFRSTAVHSVVQIGDQEQNPIAVDRPWRVLADRTRSRVVEWVPGPDVLAFAGEHRGFDPWLRIYRRISHRKGDRLWRIEDRIFGKAPERPIARFLLQGEASRTTDGVRLRTRSADPSDPTTVVTLTWPHGGRVSLEHTRDSSDRYGVRQSSPLVVVHFPEDESNRLVTEIWSSLKAAGTPEDPVSGLGGL